MDLNQQKKFANVRKTGTVGIIEDSSLHGPVSVHFSEWWNGEGMDYTIEHNKETKKFDLHLDEMRLLVTAAIVGGQIDIEECVREAANVEIESNLRSLHIEQLKRMFGV